MTNLAATLREMTVECQSLRHITVTLHNNAQADRSRIETTESTVLEHVRHFPDIADRLRSLNNNIQANKARIHEAVTAAAKKRGPSNADVQAVLEAHTASIFRLEHRIDVLSEKHARLHDATAPALSQDHGTNLDRLDAELREDLNQSTVATAGTDHSRATDPSSS